MFWHILIIVTKTETWPGALPGGGFSTVRGSTPPTRRGEVPFRVDDALSEIENKFKKSLSVMLQNSKFENVKYYGPKKIEF